MAQIFVRATAPQQSAPQVYPVQVPDGQPLQAAHDQLQAQGYTVHEMSPTAPAGEALAPPIDFASQPGAAPAAPAAPPAWRQLPSGIDPMSAAPPPPLPPPAPGQTLLSDLPAAGLSMVGESMGGPAGGALGGQVGSLIGHGLQNYFQPDYPNVPLSERLLRDAKYSAVAAGLGGLVKLGSRLGLSRPIENWVGRTTGLLDEVGANPKPVEGVVDYIKQPIAPVRPVNPMKPSRQAAVGFNQRARSYEEATARYRAAEEAARAATVEAANQRAVDLSAHNLAVQRLGDQVPFLGNFALRKVPVVGNLMSAATSSSLAEKMARSPDVATRWLGRIQSFADWLPTVMQRGTGATVGAGERTMLPNPPEPARRRGPQSLSP